MGGEGIPKTRCAREEGRVEVSSTICEKLNRIGMLSNTLPGCTNWDRGGGNEGRDFC